MSTGSPIFRAYNNGYQNVGINGIGGSYGVLGESLAQDNGVLYSAGVAGRSAFYGVKGFTTYDGSDETSVSLYTAAGVLGIGTTGVFGATTGVSSHSQYAPPNVGVWGNVDQGGTDTIGVLGRNTRGGTGVSGDGKIAIHGTADNNFSGALAGLFDGNVAINGNLTVTGTTNLTTNVNHDATLTGNGTVASPLRVASAPNGVVTTGSYANPAWITSLDGNKITAGTSVKSVNGIADHVTLAAGNNVTITPSGSTLTISASAGNTNTSLNPNQVALLRWYPLNKAGNAFAVGNNPCATTFDGSSIWISNKADNTVTKLRASDGTILGTFQVGDGPCRMAFDGANMWVANSFGNNLSKLRASDGQLLATIPVGREPVGLAFDGENMWVTNTQDSTVSKLRVSDGANLGTVSVPVPRGLAFDGTNLWVSNNVASGSVTKISVVGTPTVLAVYPAAQSFTVDVAFDGSNIWTVNSGSQSITKFRASDGSLLGTFPIGGNTWAIAFDGANMWIPSENTIYKYRASDGTLIGTTPTLSNGFHLAVAFDGANMWVPNMNTNTVSKH